MTDIFPDLSKLLSSYGLSIHGTFKPSAQDQLPSLNNSSACVILIGNVGSEMWRVFNESQEYKGGEKNPLDRWSRRIGGAIAKKFNGVALYPFDGPPYLPFLRWTQRAENLKPSPTGLNIHPKAGLWHAYRFALLLPVPVRTKKAKLKQHPCDNCQHKPCLSACPVGAFTGNSYKVGACLTFLGENPKSTCLQIGCLARHACPVGQEYAYTPQHAQFHMQAFTKTSLNKDQ